MKRVRKIVKIDPDKCNGCGICIPNCAEGAIKIIDGKAQLVGENLCDGLGACLGKCPMDAITVEERQADDFDAPTGVRADEQAVAQAKSKDIASALGLSCPGTHTLEYQGVAPHHHAEGGCPGARFRMMNRPQKPTDGEAGTASRRVGETPATRSQLGQWPVQLALVPASGPMWQDADVLICADCVPFAYPDFHAKLLAGKSLAIACPKLDDMAPHIGKLAAIFANNSVKSVTVAHMEVPCCGGIVHAVQAALAQAGLYAMSLHDITIGIDGAIKRQV
jgi:NAD-dependent dihydropyrimidine dehydrogenase PreA subunit